MKVINSFRGEYRFLSNFHPCSFEYEGLVYPNSEAAYHAAKCPDREERLKYTLIKNPVRAKQMGRREPLPADWMERSCEVMESILRAKFAVPELAECLKATGDAYLEEGNRWHDNFWGKCSCDACREKEGKNHLGRILMAIRAELNREVEMEEAV